jgi:hypothetical protein
MSEVNLVKVLSGEYGDAPVVVVEKLIDEVERLLRRVLSLQQALKDVRQILSEEITDPYEQHALKMVDARIKDEGENNED